MFLPHLTHDALPGLSWVNWVRLPHVKQSLNQTLHLTQNLPTRRFRYEMASSPRLWPHVRLPGSTLWDGPGDFTTIHDQAIFGLIMSRIPEAARATSDRGRKIEALLESFRTSYRYDRNSPGTQGDEPLVDFLRGEQRGDCKHFATAMTLMLRGLGIPARLAVGYAGGEYAAERGILTFFADDGHAWVEVMLGENLWVTIDPTPAVSDYPPRPPALVEGGFQSSGDDFADLNGLLGGGQPTFKTPELKKDDARGPLLPQFAGALFTLISLGCVGVAGLFIVLTGCFQKTSTTRRNRTARTSRLPRFLRQFLRRHARAGVRYRTGQTLCEYLSDVQEAGLADDEFNDLVAYAYGISYADLPRDPEAERLFAEFVSERKPGTE
ncbi:MAG: transglutaminase-like domain-containing protein [Verrucomicrobiota bacterium]